MGAIIQPHWDHPSLPFLFLLFLPLHGVGFAVFLFLVSRRKGNMFKALGFSDKTRGEIVRQFMAAVPVAVGFLLVSFLLTFLTSLVLQAMGMAPQPSPFFDYLQFQRPLLLAAALAGVAIIAPVTEEILFRFGLYEYLKSFGLPVPALLVAGIFALVHGDLHATPALFFLSLLLQAARKYSRGMFAPIFIHCFYNLLSSVFFLVLHTLGFAE